MGRAFSLGLLLTWVWSGTVGAEGTRYAQWEGFGLLLEGKAESTGITDRGGIVLSPQSKELWKDANGAYVAAQIWQGQMVVAKAETTELLSINNAGQASSLATLQAELITALYATKQTLWVATAPDGKLWQIDSKGTVTPGPATQCGLVWAIEQLPDQSLLLGCGEPAVLVQLDSRGKRQVLFEREQGHVRQVIYDKKMGIYLGTANKGVIYHAADGVHFRALLDTGHSEITAMALFGEDLFVAAATGAQALADEENHGSSNGSGKSGRKQRSGEIASQLIAIHADGANEVLAGSNDEVIFSIAALEHYVLVSTGSADENSPFGRIYQIMPEQRSVALWYQTTARRIMQLLQREQKTLLMTGGGSTLVELTNGYATRGEYSSEIYDVGASAALGVVETIGQWPKGTSVQLHVRTGHTDKPDTSWSPWSGAIALPMGQGNQVPPGRYLQFKAILLGDGQKTPELFRIRVAYGRRNDPPYVRDIQMLPRGTAWSVLPKEENTTKVLAVTEKVEQRPFQSEMAGMGGSPLRVKQTQQPGMMTLRWLAEDNNDDPLMFHVEVRKQDEPHYQPWQSCLEVPFVTFAANQFADGYYFFRITAYDDKGNPPRMGRSDSRESQAILMDNTPPVISNLQTSQQGKSIQIKGKVRDQLSLLASLAYSVDGQAFSAIVPVDGLLDGMEESFVFTLADLSKGSHTITVKSKDEMGNESSVATTVVIP